MRPNILTVDDSKQMRLIVQQALSAFDCDCCEAANGFNAFFVIERARTDLILLDVSMPVMDGLETLTRLKAAPELQAIPVIMLTSPADHAVMDELIALGAIGTLMKPFTERALIEKVCGVLPLKPLGDKGVNP
jgi:CheY-like chemotaxis protein